MQCKFCDKQKNRIESKLDVTSVCLPGTQLAMSMLQIQSSFSCYVMFMLMDGTVLFCHSTIVIESASAFALHPSWGNKS